MRSCVLLTLVLQCSGWVQPASRAPRLRLRAADTRRSDAEWRELLADDAYRVLREEGTEPPNSSPLDDVEEPGTFLCKGCKEPLFTTSTKFDSGSGWPSFFRPVDGASVELRADFKLVLPRTEVRCAACEGHLGHVFDDGPRPTGDRYCLNGVALNFVADADDAALAAAVAARAAAGPPVRKPLAVTLPALLFNVALSGAFFASFAARSGELPASAGVLQQAFAFFPLVAGAFYAHQAAKALR